MDKYFVYDPDYGVKFFDNKSDLDVYVEDRIEAYSDSGMWNEDVQEIVAGVVTHRIKEVDRQERPEVIDEEGFDEEGEWWDGDCTHKCNYVLDEIEDLEMSKLIEWHQCDNDHLPEDGRIVLFLHSGPEIIGEIITWDASWAEWNADKEQRWCYAEWIVS